MVVERKGSSLCIKKLPKRSNAFFMITIDEQRGYFTFRCKKTHIKNSSNLSH